MQQHADLLCKCAGLLCRAGKSRRGAWWKLQRLRLWLSNSILTPGFLCPLVGGRQGGGAQWRPAPSPRPSSPYTIAVDKVLPMPTRQRVVEAVLSIPTLEVRGMEPSSSSACSVMCPNWLYNAPTLLYKLFYGQTHIWKFSCFLPDAGFAVS